MRLKATSSNPTDDSMGAPVVPFFFWPRAQPVLNEPQAFLVHVLATIMAAILFTSEAVRTGVLDSSLPYLGGIKSSAATTGNRAFAVCHKVCCG